MRGRWIGAVVAALLLAGVSLPVLRDRSAEAAGVCDAKTKPANLDFTLKDMAGKDVKLASFRGKVIVLDFWATWCGPCKIEIPGFVDFNNRYKSQGLVVIGVSVDDSLEMLKPYLKDYRAKNGHDMNYPILLGKDRDDIQEAYGPIWGLPTTYLIGRDGKLCKKHMGLAGKEQFEREIKALL